MEATGGLRAEPGPPGQLCPQSSHPTGSSSIPFSSCTPRSGPGAWEEPPSQTLHPPPGKHVGFRPCPAPVKWPCGAKCEPRHRTHGFVLAYCFFQSSFPGNRNGKSQASSPEGSHCLLLHSPIPFGCCVQCPLWFWLPSSPEGIQPTLVFLGSSLGGVALLLHTSLINILGLFKKNEPKDSFVFTNTTFLGFSFNQNNVLKVSFSAFLLFAVQLGKQKSTATPNTPGGGSSLLPFSRPRAQEVRGAELKSQQGGSRSGTRLSEKWSRRSSASKDLKMPGQEVAVTQGKCRKARGVRMAAASGPTPMRGDG